MTAPADHEVEAVLRALGKHWQLALLNWRTIAVDAITALDAVRAQRYVEESDTEKAERRSREEYAASPAAIPSTALETARAVVREVAELPDRTSPDDWPEAMLVTAEELEGIVASAITGARKPPAAIPSTAQETARELALEKLCTAAQGCGEEEDCCDCATQIAFALTAADAAGYERGREDGVFEAAENGLTTDVSYERGVREMREACIKAIDAFDAADHFYDIHLIWEMIKNLPLPSGKDSGSP